MKAKYLMTIILFVFMVQVAAFSFSSTAFAKTKPITLRYGGNLALDHPIIVVHKRWMRKIEKESGGRIVFQEFHGGALVSSRTGAKELRKGTCDLVSLNCPIEADQFPIGSKALAFFFGAKSPESSIEIYKQVLNEFPEWKKEFDGLKPLCFQTAGPFNLIGKKAIRRIEDFKGLQIRTVGPYLRHTLAKLGASPVAMPSSEVYISLQKNIVDAVTKGNDAVKSDALAEVAPYTILLNLQEGSGSILAMNGKVFDKLPIDLKKIIDDSILELEKDYRKSYKEYVDGAKAWAKQKHGHEYISLPAEDLKKVYELLDGEARLSVEKLNSQGYPGTQIYTRIRELIEKSL